MTSTNTSIPNCRILTEQKSIAQKIWTSEGFLKHVCLFLLTKFYPHSFPTQVCWGTKGMASLPAMRQKSVPKSQDVCHLMKFLGHLHTKEAWWHSEMPSFFLWCYPMWPKRRSYMPFRFRYWPALLCLPSDLLSHESLPSCVLFRREKVKMPSDNNAGKEDEKRQKNDKIWQVEFMWRQVCGERDGKGTQHLTARQNKGDKNQYKKDDQKEIQKEDQKETTRDKAWMVDTACSSTKKPHLGNHWEHQNRIYLEEKNMFFNRYSDSKHNLTRCKTHINSKTFQHIPAYSKIFQHMGIGQNLGYPKN